MKNNILTKNSIEVKELPYSTPRVRTYPYFTALVSILGAHKKEEMWILNNYILIWVMKNTYTSDYWIDFKFGNEEIQEEFCPVIKKEIYTREEIANRYDSLEEAIKTFIDMECYLLVSVDVYYIEEWWSENSNKRHFRHQVCIHGYDFINQTITISDFINGKYSAIKVSFDSFETAYLNYNSYVPYEDFGMDIWVLSINENVDEKFNVKKNICLLNDFLMSEDTHICNHIQLENKVENYVFGLDIFNELIKYVKMVKENNIKKIDVRPFHIILEMQKVMKWRILYIMKNYDMYENIAVKDTLKEIEELCFKVKVLQSLVLKYNFTTINTIIESIITRLYEFKNKEETMLRKCLDILEKILDGEKGYEIV